MVYFQQFFDYLGVQTGCFLFYLITKFGECKKLVKMNHYCIDSASVPSSHNDFSIIWKLPFSSQAVNALLPPSLISYHVSNGLEHVSTFPSGHSCNSQDIQWSRLVILSLYTVPYMLFIYSIEIISRLGLYCSWYQDINLSTQDLV